MPAAEFSLLIFLVAGPLPVLLDFDFVMRKLGRSLRTRSRDFARCQSHYPHSRGPNAARIGLTSAIVSEKPGSARQPESPRPMWGQPPSAVQLRRSSATHNCSRRKTPAARKAPRNRCPNPRANCISRNPSICRAKLSPYPYHQTFFIPGIQSESRYFSRTISSNPKRPCVLPVPLALTPPCGASLTPKHEITSFTITVPA